MHPILFKIGPLTIYTYGLFVFLAVLFGYFASSFQAKREGIDKDTFTDICFWTIISGFLGAKLLYIMIEWQYFLTNPLAIIRSGFVFYGGVAGGLIALYFLAKKHKIYFFRLADAVVIGLSLGHILGRAGCFFYGCCYGKATQAWYGILFPSNSPAGLHGLKVIPTQLISIFGLTAIFLIILRVAKYKRFSGETSLTYVLAYGILRFAVEFFRGDRRGHIAFLSTSQFIAFFAILLSGFLLYRLHRNSQP